MPKLGVAAFLGEGDLNHFLRFPGTGVCFIKCLCLKTGRRDAKGKKKTFRRTKEGVFFFFVSKGFVINRKGCEAEIAESIPL